MENMKVLGTSGLNYYLENLLKNAVKKIILITPYIKLGNKIKEILQNKKNNGVEIIFVTRNDDKNHGKLDTLKDYSTKIYIRNNLHAKCYLTENEAIITSLNLYDFSQINNDEMGIYINNTSELYKDTLELANDLCSSNADIVTKNKVNTISNQNEMKILDVEIVEGRSINLSWNDPMQKISTNQGTYIDALKNSRYKKNGGGCDWKLYINQSITRDQYYIKDEKPYPWLNKTGN